MDNVNEEASGPMARTDTTSTMEPTVAVRRSAARTALRLAEQAADEINAKLRDAEVERDELARKLGAKQDMIDRLTSERDYRTRHVRAMIEATETGRDAA